MLQSLRDNMKGTVAVIVIAIFAVPMVLIGIEQLFMSSGNSDVATVDDTGISQAELSRAVYMRKQRILSQEGIDPNAEFLKDENLRGPVLQSLTQQAALLNAAKESGMAVSETALWQQITQQPQFQVDGIFNQQRFRQIVGNMGFTTATYLEALTEGVLLDHQNSGVVSTGFLTDKEIQQFVALAQQTRSFFSVTISRSEVENSIEVSDAEISAFYNEHVDQFKVPEKVALNYIKVDIETLAERQEIGEADIRAQYEQEIAAFDAQPQYQIAHILVEESDQTAEKLQRIQDALAAGEEFADVAQEHSDDLGSRDNGGFLGAVTTGVFPQPFEKAVYGLEEGEVSEPVKTDAGTHIIKVVDKTVPAVPSFAERKNDIEKALRRSLAQQKLVDISEQLDELTYSASDLEAAARELDLEIESTELFTRNGGQGLAGERAVVNAAFSEDVLEGGHNSAVLELADNALTVVRIADHQPERTQPLEEVVDTVREQISADKTLAALADLAENAQKAIMGGTEPAAFAEENGYAFEQKSDVSRSDVEVDRLLMRRLFSMPLPDGDQPVVEPFPMGEGDYVVLGLTEVMPGTMDSVEDAQLAAMRSQLAAQQGDFEANSYSQDIVNSAKIEIH